MGELMAILQYRALLVDSGDKTRERPLQIYASHISEIDKWAETVLANAVSKDAAVWVYETSERQLKLIPKPKTAAPVEAAK